VPGPIDLPRSGGLVPGELREYALLHIGGLFLNGSLGNDGTIADNVMDGGSDRDIFYCGGWRRYVVPYQG
jgi:hypothetical protein